MVFLQVVFTGPSASRLGSASSLGPEAPALIRLFSILLELATKDGYYFRLVYLESEKGQEINQGLKSYEKAINEGHELTHLVLVDGQRVLENVSASMIRMAVEKLKGNEGYTFVPGTTSKDFSRVEDLFSHNLTLEDLSAFFILPCFGAAHTVDQEALLNGPFFHLVSVSQKETTEMSVGKSFLASESKEPEKTKESEASVEVKEPGESKTTDEPGESKTTDELEGTQKTREPEGTQKTREPEGTQKTLEPEVKEDEEAKEPEIIEVKSKDEEVNDEVVIDIQPASPPPRTRRRRRRTSSNSSSLPPTPLRRSSRLNPTPPV